MEREDMRENSAVNAAFTKAVAKRSAGVGVDGAGSWVEYLDAKGNVAFTTNGCVLRIAPLEKGNGWMELPTVMSSSLNGTHYSVRHSDERKFDTIIGEINVRGDDNSASLTGNGLKAPFKVVHHVEESLAHGVVYESGAKAEAGGYPARNATSAELAAMTGTPQDNNANNDDMAKKLSMLQQYYGGKGR